MREAGKASAAPEARAGYKGGGHLVSGRYRLQEPIGRGAMGIVWRARDELLDREVAVKEIRTAGPAVYPGCPRAAAAPHQVAHALGDAESADVYQRALREAKAAARLNHPGVVTVFDIVEDYGGPFIIMELVPARSLDRLIAEDGPLPPLQAARVGADLLSALACAHAAGVLHRDVKPGNVLIGPNERTVLTDFGIATFSGDPALSQAGMMIEPEGRGAAWTEERATQERATREGGASRAPRRRARKHSEPEGRGAAWTEELATREGGASRAPRRRAGNTVFGTPGFTAPERVSGGSATPASDLWSLGATLYAAVEGRGPFERLGGAAAIVAGVISEDAPRAPSAGPLTGVIGALLRADPDQRPDAAEAARLLADAAAEAEANPAYASAIPADVCEPDPPWLARRRPRPRGGQRARVAVLAAAALGVAAATAGLVAWSASSRPGSAVPAPAPANTGTARAGAARSGAAPPAGYRRHEVSAVGSGGVAGFAIAAPATWLMTRKGLATYLRPSAGSASIEVSLAPFTFLRPMREAALLQAQALEQDQYPGYRLLSMRARTFLGAPDAIWKFSWDQGGAGRTDVLKLLTTVTTPAGTQPYVLTLSAPPAGFPAATEIFRRALLTFQPLP